MDHQTALLDRILDPLIKHLTPQGARELLAIRADEQAQSRIDELAEKCNEGQLTGEEQAEYDAYIAAANMLAIMQAKARRALADTAA